MRISRVNWHTATVDKGCSECEGDIYPGAQFATYLDRCVDGPSTKRTYCEECGKLLEDSLTTTEQVQ